MSILASVVAVAALTSPAPQSGRFLILAVGVNGYNVERTGFGPLNGHRDAAAFVEAMKTYFRAGKGPGDRIRLLIKDSETTRAGIAGALADLATTAKKGDRVVFYFSGHGTQIPDPKKASGYSQCIVPIDVKRVRGNEILAGTVISGPQIRNYLNQMGRNGVDNLTMVFDCCNSQHISRGTVRSKSGTPNSAPRAKSEGGLEEKGWGIDSALAIFSAAQADERAYEYEGRSIMTNEFIEALKRNAGLSRSVTYARFFAELRANVRAKAERLSLLQEPWFEGHPSLDRILFDTRTEPQPRTFPTFVRGARLKVEAGQVHGIRKGTVFGIYKPDTPLNGSPLYRAVAELPIDAGSASLNLVNDDGVKLEGVSVAPMGGWSAVILDAQPSGSLRLALDGPDDAPWVVNLLKLPGMEKGSLAGFDLRVTPPDKEATFSFPRETGHWYITNASGSECLKLPADRIDNLADEVRKIAVAEARRRAVLEISPSGRSIVNVEMEAVPIVTVASKDMGETIERISSEGARDLTLSTQNSKDLERFDQRFALRVRASTTVSAPYTPYVTVLDVTPKGAVTQLWPAERDANGNALPMIAAETRLRTDGSWAFLGNKNQLVYDGKLESVNSYKVDRGTDGVGVDTLKVIATQSEISYSALFTSGNSSTSRGPEHAFTRLFSSLQAMEPLSFRTRQGPKDNAPANWSVDTVRITIEK